MGNKRYLLGVFDDEDNMIKTAKELRQKDIKIYDIYTPFPLHGLDDLLEIKRTKLPIVCFLAATFGLAIAFAFQIWSSAIDWPVNIGGKPFNSFTAFIPVAFEITVLLGALVTVAAFLYRSKLFPGQEKMTPDLRVTHDKFIIALECYHSAIDKDILGDVFFNNGAIELEVKGEDQWT